MGYGLTLVTAPAFEPVTLIEARTHLRVTDTDEDTLISDLITAARQWCEEWTGRQIVQATWRLTLDGFPRVIRLPRPELRSVTSIVYDDANGDEQTLAAGGYKVDASGWVGRITPAYGTTWPNTYQEMGSVRVTYLAGYADSGASPQTQASMSANVPAPIKRAMLLLIGEMYKHREVTSKPEWSAEVPFGVEPNLRPYMVASF